MHNTIQPKGSDTSEIITMYMFMCIRVMCKNHTQYARLYNQVHSGGLEGGRKKGGSDDKSRSISTWRTRREI